MASFRETLRRTTGPLLGLRLVGQGAEFLAIVVFARRLGPAMFGAFSVAYLICRYLGILADWGATIHGSRQVAASATESEIGGLIRWRQITTGCAMAVYVVGSVAVGHPEVAILGVTIAGRGLSRDWLALGRGSGGRAGLPQVVQGVLGLTGAMLVHSVAGASWTMATAAGAALALSLALNRAPRPTGSVRVEQGWYVMVLLADQVYATADVVLLSLLRSNSEAGIYGAVYRFPNAWITVQGLIIAGVLPWVSRTLADHPERTAELRRRGLKLGAKLSMGALAFIPVAVLLCPVVFGPEYRPGRPALAILLLATAVSAVAAPIQPIYFAVGNERHLAWWCFLTAVVNIAGNLLLIPHLGAAGAAGVTLCSQMMIAGFLLVTTRRIAHRHAPGAAMVSAHG